MLNVMIVGGNKVDAVVEAIQSDKYNIVKAHPYVMDAFEDIINNNAVYLDLDVIVVLQHGISGGSPAEDQIKDLQDLLSVSRLGTKLYFALLDQELYNTLAADEETIVYDKTRILILQKLYQKTIIDIIEGKMDDVGLCKKKETAEEEYVEEDIVEDEPEEKVFTNVNNLPDKEPAGHTDISELRGRKKGKLGLFGGKNKGGSFTNTSEEGMTPPSNRGKIFGRQTANNSVIPIKYSGVIAVTGDRNSGISTTVANLAETFADNGNTVLIIDLDFDRRFQSYLYNEFETYVNVDEATQQGVYFALSNPENIDRCRIIVKNNTALLGLSRANEYYSSPFAEKTLEDLETAQKIINLIGVAKGKYDIVMLDFPLEQLNKHIQASIIVDKYILCTENTAGAIDNLFNIEFAKMLETSEMLTESILTKSDVVLTKYSSLSRVGKYEVDENLVENTLKTNVYSGIKVLGRISFNNDYYKQLGGEKRVIDISNIAREEFRKIAAEISRK